MNYGIPGTRVTAYRRVICLTCGHTIAMDDWLDQTGDDYNRCSNCHTQAEEH